MNINEMKEMQLLEGLGLIVYTKDYFYKANKAGVLPVLLKSVKHRDYLKDALIVETYVSKATAILLARSHIKHVHAQRLSLLAKEILDTYHIQYTYDELDDTKVEKMCCLDQSLINVNDLEIGFRIIVEKMSSHMNALMWNLMA